MRQLPRQSERIKEMKAENKVVLALLVALMCLAVALVYFGNQAKTERLPKERNIVSPTPSPTPVRRKGANNLRRR
jgi:hypothetical protein